MCKYNISDITLLNIKLGQWNSFDKFRNIAFTEITINFALKSSCSEITIFVQESFISVIYGNFDFL